MSKKLKIFNVYWSSETAGVSPDNNRRTEIFLSGCKKATNGNPCKGCFNPDLWGDDYITRVSPEELLRQVKKFAPNKYITFVGGEPLDQLVPLAETCELLNKNGYHITVFSHYTIEEIDHMESQESVKKFLTNIAILIDGEYKEEKKIYDKGNLGDGICQVIGSSNQVIWDLQSRKSAFVYGIEAIDLVALYLTPNNVLKYITKEDFCPHKEYFLKCMLGEIHHAA